MSRCQDISRPHRFETAAFTALDFFKALDKKVKYEDRAQVIIKPLHQNLSVYYWLDHGWIHCGGPTQFCQIPKKMFILKWGPPKLIDKYQSLMFAIGYNLHNIDSTLQNTPMIVHSLGKSCSAHVRH